MRTSAAMFIAMWLTLQIALVFCQSTETTNTDTTTTNTDTTTTTDSTTTDTSQAAENTADTADYTRTEELCGGNGDCCTTRAKCIFPFRLQEGGKWYNGSCSYVANGGKAWCATSTDKQGIPLTRGDCAAACPVDQDDVQKFAACRTACKDAATAATTHKKYKRRTFTIQRGRSGGGSRSSGSRSSSTRSTSSKISTTKSSKSSTTKAVSKFFKSSSGKYSTKTSSGVRGVKGWKTSKGRSVSRTRVYFFPTYGYYHGYRYWGDDDDWDDWDEHNEDREDEEWEVVLSWDGESEKCGEWRETMLCMQMNRCNSTEDVASCRADMSGVACEEEFPPCDTLMDEWRAIWTAGARRVSRLWGPLVSAVLCSILVKVWMWRG
eukprot:TRINITY_DN75405_c0_g1_i1.p1 TRINITY_DN75405_c0_g1~~TRINITY_DN75405_c0_g1_i1.p1  ORF type:complete len:378 (+),score=29.76 TRINITY_DN75405_c0_g1_i1:72-1205(+)